MKDQFPFAVARVTRRWRKLLDERLKDLGVTQARWTTMVYLKEGGEGLTQRELAGLMAIENPTLVRLLDSLEQQHLIERRACPNIQGRTVVNILGAHSPWPSCFIGLPVKLARPEADLPPRAEGEAVSCLTIRPGLIHGCISYLHHSRSHRGNW